MKLLSTTLKSATLAMAVTLAGATGASANGFAHVTSVEVGPGQYESGYVQLFTGGESRVIKMSADDIDKLMFAKYVDIDGQRYHHMTGETGYEGN